MAADRSGARTEESSSPEVPEVSWALHRLLVAAAALDATLGPRLDLGPSEYRAMKHLLTADRPVGPVELGSLVGLTSGAATSLVDRLERAGHLTRSRHPHDRRRLVLEPTAAAVAAARGQLRPLEESLETILQGYTDEERRVVGRFLDDARAAYLRFTGGEEEGPSDRPPGS